MIRPSLSKIKKQILLKKSRAISNYTLLMSNDNVLSVEDNVLFC